jgi:hypothetical protein
MQFRLIFFFDSIKNLSLKIWSLGKVKKKSAILSDVWSFLQISGLLFDQIPDSNTLTLKF